MESVCSNFMRHIRRQYLSSNFIGRYGLYSKECIYHFKLKNRIEDYHRLVNKDFKAVLLPEDKDFTVINKGQITLITKNYNIDFSVKFKYQDNYYELNNYYPMYNHLRDSYLLVDIGNKIDIKLRTDKVMMILMSNQ